MKMFSKLKNETCFLFVSELMTRNVNYEYIYLLAPQNAPIRFKVKAANDVHVLLTESANATGSDPYREVRHVQPLLFKTFTSVKLPETSEYQVIPSEIGD